MKRPSRTTSASNGRAASSGRPAAKGRAAGAAPAAKRSRNAAPASKTARSGRSASPAKRSRTADGAPARTRQGSERTKQAVGRSKAPAAPRTTSADDGIAVGPVRLNKAIADAGVASRRHADEMIASGVVRVNGTVVTELGHKVGIRDIVTVNGEPITRVKHLTYILLNKPKDAITTSSDEKGRATVFDLVKIRTRLFTVGRLDRNTMGVLLLTNDGDLAHRLMHPRYGIARVYKARLDRPCKPEHAREISHGIDLDDGPTQPCEVIIDPEDRAVVHIQIREGRNREVRRIFEAMGYDVRTLDRKQYAFLTTRGLNRGEYRHLTRDEVAELRRLVNL